MGLGHIAQAAVLPAFKPAKENIALPNSLHREFTVQAMRVGVHVIYEKPLATNIHAKKRPSITQVVTKPPVRKPRLVHAMPASR